VSVSVGSDVAPRRAASEAAAPKGRTSHLTVIAAGGESPGLAVGELWAYRGLLYFLVWRDLKVRYTQTVLGVAWAVLQPLLNTVVFTLVFGRLVHVPTDGVPYAAFVLTALVPWTYVSTSVGSAGNSLLNSSNLITKVYFPRLVIPWAPVCAAAVDFGIGMVLVAIALAVFHLAPSPIALVVVPASIAMFALTAAGVGCWLAALGIQFRDVKHLIPFVTTMWMYGSPIVYPMSKIPERYRLWYALNPMAGTVEAFRAALVGLRVAWGPWLESSIVAVVIFATGALYFRRIERVFADIV
jgi:lipopolysaccharide transport system permease protein